jgi:Dof domain, zinc finger
MAHFSCQRVARCFLLDSCILSVHAARFIVSSALHSIYQEYLWVLVSFWSFRWRLLVALNLVVRVSRRADRHVRVPALVRRISLCRVLCAFFCHCHNSLQDCQRYWTVGGVLRNVPPGSGRRKSRSAASREGRRPSNLASAPQSGSGVGSTETALPENMINSNPLASVLMSSLGLGSSEALRSQPAAQVRMSKTDGASVVNRMC